MKMGNQERVRGGSRDRDVKVRRFIGGSPCQGRSASLVPDWRHNVRNARDTYRSKERLGVENERTGEKASE